MKNKIITPDSANLKAIRGMSLSFTADPFLKSPEECYTLINDALIVMSEGRILDIGDYAELAPRYPELTDITRYDDALIIPGLIDCHAHYVQSPMIASCGDTLLEWLERYTFPTESKFRSKDFAAAAARQWFGAVLSQGTTTANVFATTFAESVDAFFEESERYNTRMICGKVLQDRNLPPSLRDASAEESVELAESLMKKWHGRGRQLYAVIPRFAPTSTPRQLELAGRLYGAHVGEGVYLHTHLDEAEGEIEWVKELFPECRTYTDVYRRYGLLGERSVMAHCCVVEEEEWRMLHDFGCGVAHCPSSNLFLGDGEFRYWEAKQADRPLNVGMATDVGGGTNFSVLRQLGEAYKVAMLQGRNLDAVRSLFLATRGGAETLRLADRIGSLEPGMEADIAVVDLAPDEFTAWRMQFCEDIFQRLFVLTTLGSDRMIRATYVAGERVFNREK